MEDIDIKQKTEEITRWLGKTVRDSGFERVVVAVSGGIDSAVSLHLAVRALGKDQVYALLLPYGTLSTKTLLDGKEVVSTAGLEKDHVVVRDIKKVVDKIVKQVMDERIETIDSGLFLEKNSEQSNATKMMSIRKGNIMARMRMIFLYDMAKALDALVIGTENKSEYLLGYYTRFGDEASDIEPIRDLYKTQVFEMAAYLGVPQQIREKAPSANLWEGQSDEKEFGFSYEDADRVLYHYCEEGLPKEGIVALGLSETVVDAVLQYVKKNDFKHKVPFVKE